MPTVKEIIVKYLKDNGYDGLCHVDSECGCEIGDLIPCSEPSPHCTPGYRVECDYDDKAEGPVSWYITPEKPNRRSDEGN